MRTLHLCFASIHVILGATPHFNTASQFIGDGKASCVFCYDWLAILNNKSNHWGRVSTRWAINVPINPCLSFWHYYQILYCICNENECTITAEKIELKNKKILWGIFGR